MPGDIRLLVFATNVAESLFENFKYSWLPEEFKTRLPLELDFVKEADNCEKCGAIFEGNQNVAVPSVYRKFTTSRVLTMSFE